MSRKGIRLPSQIEGGNQENNRRAGHREPAGDCRHGQGGRAGARPRWLPGTRGRGSLRDRLIKELPKRVERVYLTGHPELRLPGHASFCIEFVEGEGMLLFLDDDGIASRRARPARQRP